MKNLISAGINKILFKKGKYETELNFWRTEIENYVAWYEGKLRAHYGTPAPQEYQKVKTYVPQHNAMLTRLRLHQEPKYLKDLLLDKKAFFGLRVLDVGSGPLPSALVFEGCELYCLDPLLPEYIRVGYPIHYYERVRFVKGFAEDMPLEDSFIDAVISVNAIDHVDNIRKTALEVKRVLKPGGKIRIHAHYHKKTVTEPLELNDDVMVEVFHGCDGFEKIKESKQKAGTVPGRGEAFALWSNF